MRRLTTGILLLISGSLFAQGSRTVFHQSVEWSRDGKLICFAATIIPDKKFQKGMWEIYVINSDGTGMRKITENVVDDSFPSFSPDGKQIAFNSTRDGTSQIYKMDIDGKNVVRLTNSNFSEHHPAWSPDGRSIVFASNRDSNEELYIMNSDGSNQKRLTQTEFREYNAAWSPDGKKVAFYYEKGDNRDQVYVMNSDGSHSFNVTSDTLNNIFPSWYSNDKVVYSAGSNGLVKVSIDGSRKEKLGITSFYGRFSPDGNKLCFVRGRFPDTEIHIQDIATKDLIKIDNREILK